MAELSITFRQQQDLCRVQLRGELDLATVGDFKAAVLGIEGPLEIDFGQLAFIDATGLGVLAILGRHNQNVSLCNESPMLSLLLDLFDLRPLFESCESTAA